MEKTANGWTIIDRDAGVLSLKYTFAKGASSTTFVARMGNGQLLVVSPSTRLTDEIASDLSAFGEVGALVANNGLHHLGQAEWRKHFPNARCFAPPEASARIGKKSKIPLDFEPLAELQALAGPDLHIREVPNTKIGEMWCSAKIGEGHAWFVSDVLANMPEPPKAFVPRMLFKMTGSAPGYRVFNLALKFVVRDKKGTLRLLRDDMTEREPTIIVPAHGNMLAMDGLAAQTRELIESAL